MFGQFRLENATKSTFDSKILQSGAVTHTLTSLAHYAALNKY